MTHLVIPAKALRGGGPPRSQGRNDGGSHAGTSTIGVIPANAGIQNVGTTDPPGMGYRCASAGAECPGSLLPHSGHRLTEDDDEW